MKIFFTFILVSFALTFCNGQKTDLRLKLEKGKVYKQNTNSKATIIQDFNGQKMNMVLTTNGTTTFLVKAINEKGYVLEAKFEKLGLSMQSPQGSMEFSSEKNYGNDIFSKILGAMKNGTFEVTMTTKGKIIDVKNVEAIWENAINQFDQLPEMQKAQIKAQLMKAYGTAAIKGNIEMTTAIYPDQLVNKVDKWTINTNLESGMSAKMITAYQFVGLTSDYALIKGNSIIKTNDKDAYIETNGMPLKYDLNGSMVAEIKIDKNTGWIVEAKMNQEIKGTAYIKENPQLPNGMTIPMTMLNEMLVTNE